MGGGGGALLERSGGEGEPGEMRQKRERDR